MVVIGDYSIEQYIQQNKIVITLPQTMETVTDTLTPFIYRKAKLKDTELAQILLNVIEEMRL